MIWKFFWQILFIFSVIIFTFMLFKFTFQGYKDLKKYIKNVK